MRKSGLHEAWRPFAVPVFRALWIAQFVSNTGTWMMTVGAQWELIGQSGAVLALVQTATSLPPLLLAFPAGLLADRFDRRRLLIAAQYVMLAASAALAVAAFTGLLGPGLLLALLFVIGGGSALMGPAWQAIQPDLVDRASLPQAAALGSVSMNLARAVGPALGGFVLALAGTGWVFAFNAVSYLGTAAVLTTWRAPHRASSDAGREGILAAVDAGRRYIRYTPDIRRVLLRTLLFVPAASALWVLLPLVAEQRLALGASGYGLLLGAVGLGAVAGAFLLPWLRRTWGANGVLLIAAALCAAVLTALALPGPALIVMSLLPAAGLAWISALAVFSAAVQTRVPGWVRARALAVQLMVFQGGMALSAPLWGLLADRLGLAAALGIAAAVVLGGGLSVRFLPLPVGEADPTGSDHWPEPSLTSRPDPDAGPVLVTVVYRVPQARTHRFLAAMEPVARARRRTGAITWGLYRDGDDPELLVEHYLVATWSGHLAQHHGRLTADDRAAEEAARALLADGTVPEVTHAFDAFAADGSCMFRTAPDTLGQVPDLGVSYREAFQNQREE
ncbi:MFS transporter [Streptomyces inhibens]|uniref:MFS transporter n=1 Tax=Streptomyces inhibens TaxID=2293571 RepID=UPI00369C34CC